MTKKYGKWGVKILAAIACLGLSGCIANPITSNNENGARSSTSNSQFVNSQKGSPEGTQSSDIGGIDQQTKDQLAQKEYQSGSSAIVQVNNGKSTLNPDSWQENKVIYSNLDSLNRTSSPNTAFLEARNKANESLRIRQTVAPTGWHSNRGGNQLYNRGHMIAYSVSAGIDQNGAYNPNNTSGDQNNPKNLFTQSAFSNQELQTIYESQVRHAIEANKKVIYQVTPIFRGNELMARGVNLQAVSTDGSLNFNVYIFNVQPGIKFNYADGSNQVDTGMQVPTPPNTPIFNNNNQTNSSNRTRWHFSSRHNY